MARLYGRAGRLPALFGGFGPGGQYADWAFFPNDSGIYAKCKTPTSCDPDVHPLGKMPTLEACQKAVNGVSPSTPAAAL